MNIIYMEEKFTPKDIVVQDTLKAIASYSQKPSTEYKLLLLGGMATQLYAYNSLPDLMRPTTDIDLVGNKLLTYSLFKHEVGLSIAQRLENYNPEIKPRSHHTFQLSIKDRQGDPLLVHLYRRSKNRFELEKRTIERQFSNANTLPIPNSDKNIDILRLEDLLEQKVGRFSRLKRLERIQKIPKDLREQYDRIKKRDYVTLASQDLADSLQELKKEKTRLPSYYDHGHEAFQEALDHYGSSKDIFDVCVMLKLAMTNALDFDENYFNKTLQEELI